jgi:predicted alpha/beta superfamily hydrolase
MLQVLHALVLLAAVAADPLPTEVAIPNTRHVEFTSAVNGHRYAIDVGIPLRPPPATGYRVLYVLDGFAYFASALEAVRANGNAPDVVVVGISYPHDAAFAAEVLLRHQPLHPYFQALPPARAAAGLQRGYDLTPPISDAKLAADALPGAPPEKASNYGGLDDFLQTIETEVKPRVASLVAIDRAHQALFGHSLGGLAVVHALFTEPQAFETFIAASPSIWWNDKAVLAGERNFAAQVASGAARPRVLVTVGAEEGKPPKLPPEEAANQKKFEAMARSSRMVGNACDLAGRLQRLHGTAPYEVADCAVFAGQHHGISPWPALGRAVQFAFPQR